MRRPTSVRRVWPRSRAVWRVIGALLLAPVVAGSDFELGKGAEARLAPGESIRFPVALEAGQLFHLAVEQRGADVTLQLLAPDGGQVWFSDDRDQGTDREWVWWVAAATGTHTVVVTNKGRLAGAIVVSERVQRVATAEDRLRARIERWLSQVALLRRDRTQQPLNRCVAAAQEALALLADPDLAGADFAPRRRHAARSGLGLCQEYLGHVSEARSAFSQDLAESRARGSEEAEADTLAYLANLAGNQGDFLEATHLTEQAAEIYSRLGRPGSEAFARNNLGIYYSRIGLMDRVSQSYERALECFRQAQNESGATLAKLNLGESYRRQGRVDEALVALDEALQGSRAIGNHTWEATALNTLGAVFGDLGDYQAARHHAEQALAIRHAAGDQRGEASSRANIAELLLEDGDSSGARQQLAIALDLYRRVEDKDGEAWVLYLSGRALRQERPAEALVEWEQALSIRHETGAVEEEAWLLTAIGEAETDGRSFDQARAHLEQSLSLFRSIAEPEGEAHVLYLLARLERALGDRTDALRDAEAAVARAESVRVQVASTDLRASYQARVRPYHELLVEVLSDAWDSSRDPAVLAKAFEGSERARARALLDLLAAAAADLDATLDSGLRSRLQQVESAISSRQRRLVDLAGVGRRDAAASREAAAGLEQAFDDYDRLKDEIRRSNPRYAGFAYPQPATLPEAERLVGDGSVLFEYFVGESTSFLFAVDDRGVEVHRLPRRSVIEASVNALRAALETPGRLNLGRLALTARELYAMLVAPAAARLRPGVRLIVAPDGPLYRIPFEVLLTEPASAPSKPETWPYLLRDHVVRYVPSVAVVRQLAERTSPRRLALFAVGDPERAAGTTVARGPVWRSLFSGAEAAGLAALPGARREVQRIARLFPPGQVELLVGKQATESAVKQGALGDARYVHFATHGLVSESRPVESGLVLARSAQDAEDGFLQVHEILALKLNADLVALSACHTGLGRDLKGEGLLGLTQAFFFSGASNVVATLWALRDDSASDLMAAFYRRLAKGLEPEQALRDAKLELLRKGVWSHPHHWAPFVLVGRGR